MQDRIYLIFEACFLAGAAVLFFSGKGWSLQFKGKSHGQRNLFEKFLNMFREVISKEKLRRNIERADREVYEAISYLRNMIAIDAGKHLTTDAVISELSKKEGVMQKDYLRMLSLLRVNKKDEAQDILKNSLCTTSGKEFA